MKKITDELIINFKKYLIEEEKSENTIDKYIRDITFFMAWLCGQEVTKILALEYKKELCESAGVSKDKVYPHSFRHLFSRTYYNLQKDIVRLADILEHLSVNTTRIYTMESGEVYRRQIQKLGLLRC